MRQPLCSSARGEARRGTDRRWRRAAVLVCHHGAGDVSRSFAERANVESGVHSEVQRVDDIEEMGRDDERESRLVTFITILYRHLPSYWVNTAPNKTTNSS